jgi:opacity protein-like surface antigen
MRRLISVQVVGLLAIGLFLSIPSFAQEVIYPKAEVFGGFSLSSIPGVTTFDPTTGLPASSRKMFMGWQAAANFNLTHHLGIVGDFGGQYASIPSATVLGVTIPSISMNTYQFLFGPQIAFRKSRVTPFVHALFGADKFGSSTTISILGTSTTVAVSSTGLGMGFGGGLDINISDRLALRVPQFDWTLRHIGSTTATVLGTTVTVPGTWSTGQIRFGIGLVVKAGQK